MKFLRKDSGHIFIFRGPSSHASKTAASEHASVALVLPPAVVVPPAAPTVASHCCFICRSCGSPILLPHDQMGMPFAHPSLRRIEVRTIAAVCASCHHIDNYSLFRGCPGFNTRHKLMPAPTAGTTFLLEWLHCDGSDCPFKVPFFVNFDRNLSYEERSSLTANWFWQDLTCIAGHRIRPLVSAPRPDAILSTI